MSVQKSVTIKQVAKEAGVSIQTVSRVINQRYDVSAETRDKVQKIIERLGYQPNAIARGLASRRSRTLGLVTYDLTDAFFAQVVTGAEAEAHRYGYFFMLGSSRCNPCEEPNYIRLLTERHVEGILFAREGTPTDLRYIEELHRAGIPVVMTGFYNTRLGLNLVDVNNLDGGYQATQHLVRAGHRWIAFISGPMFIQSGQDRQAGYRRALEEAGIAFDPALAAEGDYLHRSGYAAMQHILGSGHPFTGLFASNDRMAIGAISALRQAGLRVPDDVSVVGFDDLPEAEFAVPPLTTMRQPMVKVGEEAMRLLLNAIQNPGQPPRQVLLETELIERQSVRAIA